MGIHEIMPARFVNRPSGVDSYLFTHFYDSVHIQVGAELQKCPRDTFMIWTPLTPHYFGALDGTWDHSWFYWDGVVVTRYLNECEIPLNQPIRFGESGLVDKYLLQAYEELSKYPQPDNLIVRDLLHIMFREIMRARRQDVRIHLAPPTMLEIRQYLGMRFHKPICLRDIAENFYISVSHLCAQFTKHFGTSPIEYIHRLRMQQVVNLMRDQEMTLSQIARKVGYDDLSYFSKAFKKRFGVGPRSYRRMLTESPRTK
jgi:AraC-like DNA-binding protein